MHKGLSDHNYANDLLSCQLLQTAFTQTKKLTVFFFIGLKKTSGQAFKNHSQSTVCLHLIMELEQLTLGLCFVLYSMAGCGENTILKSLPFKMYLAWF